MRAFEVTLSRAGAGSGTFKVVIYAATPDMARRNAELQNSGYSAQSVRAV